MRYRFVETVPETKTPDAGAPVRSVWGWVVLAVVGLVVVASVARWATSGPQEQEGVPAWARLGEHCGNYEEVAPGVWRALRAPGCDAPPVQASAPPSPALSILECGRVFVRYDGQGAGYWMDGPMGMASPVAISTWHSLSIAQRVGFLEYCGK